jgi:hypothetical protein
MSFKSAAPLSGLILLTIFGTACNTKITSASSDRVHAKTSIAKWNQEHPDQPVSIVDWPALKAQCQSVQGNTLLLVMTYYCHGVDLALASLDSLPENSSKKPDAVVWVSNDHYKDIDLFLARVSCKGFKGRLDILDNDEFGGHGDQRKRNKVLLKKICHKVCGDVVYLSGLVAILMDHNGQMLKAGNMVDLVLGTRATTDPQPSK